MGGSFTEEQLPEHRAPDLIGRELLVDLILERLESSPDRLTLLLGPGGVGKSSLALTCLAQQEHPVRRSAPFVELASVTDERLILPAIAAALNLREGPSSTLLDAIAAQLENGPGLIVLDNLEQIPGAFPVVQELLDAAPTTRVLGTSRRRLGIRDEQVVEITPLAIPIAGQPLPGLAEFRALPAIALFERRVQRHLPDFTVTQDNINDVADIVRRLDGMPLAIELVASRARVLSVAEMSKRLGELMPLPNHERSGFPQRQQTIADSVAWTAELLPESTRHVLARLSAFPGRFDLDAANAVADASIADIDLLLEHYLLRLVETDRDAHRFDMRESVRQFGKAELRVRGEESLVRDRHAEWRVNLTRNSGRDHFGPHPEGVVRRTFDAFDDFNQAMAWSLERNAIDRSAKLLIDISPFRSGVPWEVSTIWWERLLPNLTAETIGAELLTMCWIEVASVHYGVGNLAESDRVYTRAADAARQLGNFNLLAEALYGLCATLRGLTQFDRAEQLLDELRTIQDKVDDPAARYRLFIELGAENLMIRNDLDGAWQDFQNALALARENQAHAQVGNTLHFLGYVAMQRRAFDVARDAFTRSIEALGKGPETQRLAALHGLGRSELLAGRPGEAYPALRASLEGRTARGETLQMRFILADMALLARSIHRPRLAAEWFGAANLDAHHLSPQRFFADRWIGALAALREELGDEEFERAFDRGRVMGLAESVQAALHLAPTGSPVSPAINPGGVSLSARESEVLRLIVAGSSDRQIADALFISPLTATKHVKNILRKLGVHSRTAAAMAAVRAGVIGPDS